MARKAVMIILALCVMAGSAGIALADSSASFFAPANGSSYLVGTCVQVTGQATGFGTSGGTGLDLMLVIDESGSMAGSGIASAKTAAKSLIDALPTATTQAGLVSFDSSGYLRQGLLAMSTPANVTTLKNAVDALVAGGGTTIGAGITVATNEILANGISGHAKMQVVLSDGYSSGTPETQAAAAYAAGITVHAVGIPGHDAAQMQAIATAGHGIYTNVTSLSALEALFNGTGGNLVGLDHMDLTLPDGTVLNNYATDGLGNLRLLQNPLKILFKAGPYSPRQT